MGLFDFFKKKGSNPPPAGPTLDKKVAGFAKVAADKQAQTYDRMEALQALAEMKSADAATALLKRFSFSIDPSITDQEEKEVAFQGILAAGDEAIERVLEYCARADVLTWPLKILRELMDEDRYKEELVTLLARFDTEYVRNVEPKIQVITAMEEVRSEEIRDAVVPFLEDVNEGVRFHAVETLFAQNDATIVAALVKMLEAEESVRIKNKVAEGLLVRAWAIPQELRASASKSLVDSSGYGVGAQGKIEKGATYD